MATMHCNGFAQTSALDLSVQDCRREESFPLPEMWTVKDAGVSPAHEFSRVRMITSSD